MKIRIKQYIRFYFYYKIKEEVFMRKFLMYRQKNNKLFPRFYTNEMIIYKNNLLAKIKYVRITKEKLYSALFKCERNEFYERI